jgi:HPt (histidine-containing phosphotransfer) domain-containing protein
MSLCGSVLLWSLARGAGNAGWAWTGLMLALTGLALAVAGLWWPARSEAFATAEHMAAVERENSELAGRAQALEAAQRESDVVFGSMRGHLMLIDSSYFIQRRYSNELEAVFHQRDHGNENLINVFQRILSERMFKVSRDYLGLLFDPSKKERTVLKVNPLDEVEVDVTGPDGAPLLKYLHFSFRRVIEDGRIARVLVTVEDVTERTTLERQLRDSERQKVRQFELLIGILHVAPKALDGFVQAANEQLALVDEALKASDFGAATTGQTALLRQRLDLVLQRVHNIKGNASLLRLEHFEMKAQEFEQKVVDLKYRGALGGDDFLTLVIALADFRSDLDSLQTLRVKLAAIQRGVENREEVGDDVVSAVRDLAATTAKRLGKEVRIDAHGFDTRDLPANARLIVKDVLIQLVRNSLAHGIELPAERQAAGKPRVAAIDIQTVAGSAPDCFAFFVRDDGRGLDAEKIKRRALAAGLLSPERALEVDDSEIASFIFATGFTTAEEASLESGRGMGMSLIKERIVDDGGGEITVSSETGRFCEFAFVLPRGAARLSTAAR